MANNRDSGSKSVRAVGSGGCVHPGCGVRYSPWRSGAALVLPLILVLSAGCGGHDPGEGTLETLHAHVALPSYPYAENQAIRIDPALLDELAGGFLAGGGRPDEVARFFFSHVPLRAFARIAAAELADLESLEGLLYLSGFFGGVWLKGVLAPAEASFAGMLSPAGKGEPKNQQAGDPCPPVPCRTRSVVDNRSPGSRWLACFLHPAPSRSLTGMLPGLSAYGLGQGSARPPAGAGPSGSRARPAGAADPATNLFSVLAFFVETLVETARSADGAALNRILLDNLDAFILLYGYNLGYLQSILDNPPGGVTPPAGYLVCDGFLDCRTPESGIPALQQALPLIDRVENPPDERWERMQRKVLNSGPQAVEMGYRVWTEFLSVEEMLPEDYQVLLDLSAGFLVYCQLLVLTSMDAWVSEDEGTARAAAALSAGMTTWVGGYGIGLVSDYPGDHLPSIEVSGTSSPAVR